MTVCLAFSDYRLCVLCCVDSAWCWLLFVVVDLLCCVIRLVHFASAQDSVHLYALSGITHLDFSGERGEPVSVVSISLSSQATFSQVTQCCHACLVHTSGT